MTTTREIYLDNFEKLPESELARLAGVSRQRIHQLETQLHVCKMSPSLKPNLGHHCIDCGKQIAGYKRCHQCHFKARKPKLIILVCPTCETKFPIDKKVHEWKLKHGQKEFFCSRKCLGVPLGKNYGSKTLVRYTKEHPHQPKHDYDMVWQKHKETGFGCTKLSQLLGIPQGTISCILGAKRREIAKLDKD